MLFFISLQFQYMKGDVNLNTSHVILYLIVIMLSSRAVLNLNTSHVILYRYH